MKKAIRATVLGLAISAMVVAAAPTQANASHQIGHFIAGAALGAIIAGGIAANANQGGYNYVAPAYGGPVYVQPRVCIRKEKYFDPYAGWVWRQVQYYC